MDIKSSFIDRKRGYFYVAIDYYDTDSGKIKQKLLKRFQNKKDVEKHLIEVKNFSTTTLKRSKTVIDKHISGFFKNTKLSDVSVSLYQRFINHLYTKDLKVSTIKEILNKSDAVLHECYRLREIPEKIPDFIMHPQCTDSTFKEVYTIDESKKILIEVSSVQLLNIPIHLLLLGGLRF
ncbi:MAG: hypothetical protein E6649_05115 [Paeniclostridium sordellii]|nr:hypothetical protein [Paeniclostridium sordellii]